ncbi:MAG: Glucose-6-phosphate isomerase [Deltaproteobacteria bacterium ADurb.Bin510]|nr:MAG: Glucose-6-phosphate isomerase [Deltaproteobacteria bacterium ADurb.Bin510]
MIRFDFSGVSRDLIGEHGLSASELEALIPASNDAHSRILNGRADETIGFYELPRRHAMIDAVKAVASSFKGRFKNIVSLGIGGSSLGPKTIFSALTDPLHNIYEEPKLFFLENIDPEQMASLLKRLKPAESLFIVISKSGTTAEPAAQFMVVLKLLKESLGERYREHLIFITDPAKGVLRPMAEAEGIASLAIPPEVGGRFSVLTPVGLLPAALLGLDIDGLLAGADQMAQHCLKRELNENPAYLYGAIHYLLLTRGVNISVLMPYSSALYDLADWYRQLWAESLGKRLNLDGKTVHCGQTPVKALGATDQHSQVQLYIDGPFDKIINIIKVKNYRADVPIPRIMDEDPALGYLCDKSIAQLLKAETDGTAAALIKSGRPTVQIELDTIDAATLGALFMFFEAATAYTGFLLKIDPFDQPGVELGKQITFGLMGRAGYLAEGLPAALPGFEIRI